MSSSCWHGVTSVVMGNCGMTFAPVRPGAAERARARRWSRSRTSRRRASSTVCRGTGSRYGEYLDVVDGVPEGHQRRAATSATSRCARTSIGRRRVRARLPRDRRPADRDGATRSRGRSLAAGAFGYSISRSLTHRVPDGRWVPGTWADPTEFFAVGAPLGRARSGRARVRAPLQRDANGTDGPGRRRDGLDRRAQPRRSVARSRFNLTQMRSLGDHYRRVLELRDRGQPRPARSCGPRPRPASIGVLFSLAANTPVDHLPCVRPLRRSTLAGRLAAIRDPEVRARADRRGPRRADRASFESHVPDAGPSRPLVTSTPTPTRSRDRPAPLGVAPVELYLDALDASDGAAIVNWPVLNEDFDAIEEMLTYPVTIMGLADAGRPRHPDHGREPADVLPVALGP